MSGEQDFRQQGRAERPVFFPDEPAADKLFAIVNVLVTELAVLRERQDTMERLMAQKEMVAADEIEAYRADDEAEQQRRAWRDSYLRRVYAVLLEDAETDDRNTPLAPLSKAG
jgi:hypothetical protein